MTEENRRQLRRANVLVRGLILRAKFARNREELSSLLSEALLTYGLLDFT